MKAILIKQKFIDYCGIVMAEMPQLEVVEIEPKLDTYYKMLDCDAVPQNWWQILHLHL